MLAFVFGLCRWSTNVGLLTVFYLKVPPRWRGVCVLLLQGESGMEAEIKIEGRTVQVRALDVRLVLPQCTVQRFKIAMSKRSPVNQGTDP